MSLEDALRAIRQLDYGRIEKNLVRQLRAYAESTGRARGVVGLSGGLDSSVTACLVARALGADNTIGMLLPGRATRAVDERHARQVARMLGIKLMRASVARAVDVLKAQLADNALRPMTRIDEGNLTARARMACLYNVAARAGGLVVGTGDRSEILLGYFTKYGDGGVDVLPLGGLFKSQVRALAEHFGLPRAIVQKPPSPNFWLGQTAEEELGASYEEIDAILWALFEKKWGEKKTARALGVKEWLVRRVIGLYRESGHKRTMPPILKPF
ncbi:MAG: NAD+ synthase [Candidatus Micrarchaeia archaeon]